MIKKRTILKSTMIFISTTLLVTLSVYAQDTVIVGNKPRQGTSDSKYAVMKGEQIGIKMNVGSKTVKLLKLNLGANNINNESMEFKVNVYDFDKALPGENLVKQSVSGTIPKGKNRVNVDLSAYNIQVKGNILVAIEWINPKQLAEPSLSLRLFNGGTWKYENHIWKKTPVFGVDFNVAVETNSK